MISSNSRVDLPLGLQEGEKFALFAMKVLYPPRKDFKLDSGLRVYRHFPREMMDQIWAEWLGSIFIKRVNDCNFIVISSIASKSTTVIDAEYDDLRRQVDPVFSLIGLHRIKLDQIPYLITGYTENNKIICNQQSPISSMLMLDAMPFAPADDSFIRDANLTIGNLSNIHGTHQRFLRGLGSLYRSWTESDIFERMICTVRALDAVFGTTKNYGTMDFERRGQHIIGKSEEAKQFLGRVYLRRNKLIHMHGLEELHNDKDFQAIASSIDADNVRIELLATEFYRKVLYDSKLLAHFTNQDSIIDFWKLMDSGSRSNLDLAINTNAIQRESELRRTEYCSPNANLKSEGQI